MTVFLIPGLNPEDRKRWNLPDDDPGPVSAEKPRFEPGRARLIEEQQLAAAAPKQSKTTGKQNCILVEPRGNYRTAPGQAPRFDPDTAGKLSRAIDTLNQQKITPVITSGYRSPDLQRKLRDRAKTDPNVNSPARVSQHQVGRAVDFGPNSNRGNEQAIRKAMIDAGLTWGGKIGDPMHYQDSALGRSPDPALVQACLNAMRRR